jgi:methylmalonyl-CoA decarboxylase
MAFIRNELSDHVATIAFDREDKKNAFNAAFMDEMIAALAAFEAKGARCVVVRSAAGGRVWSAGHDVAELPRAGVDPLPYSDPLERLLRAVRAFPAPVIAMVRGSAWGGACELALTCDLAYGDETAAFAITPAKLGLPYTAGGLQTFMARLPLSIVKEMFFSADPIDAGRALRAGLVNEIVPNGDLEARVYGKARTIAERSPAAIAASKRAIQALSENATLSPQTFEYLNGLRRAVYMGSEYAEGIAAFLDKRPPRF